MGIQPKNITNLMLKMFALLTFFAILTTGNAVRSNSRGVYLHGYNAATNVANWHYTAGVQYGDSRRLVDHFLVARGEGLLLYGLNNPNRIPWSGTNGIRNRDDVYPCSLNKYSNYYITETLLRAFFPYFDNDLRNVWKEEIRENGCEIKVHETIPANCNANDLCNQGKHMTVVIEFRHVWKMSVGISTGKTYTN